MIYATKDGAALKKMSKEELLDRLEDDRIGPTFAEENEFVEDVDEESSRVIRYDPKTLIIKGKEVVPEPKKVVTEYQIE